MTRVAGAALWRLRRLFSHLSSSATLAAVPRSTTAAYSTAITSAKVEVNGIHLHYQQTGNGNHAVLLLPGMLGSGQTDFEPQLKNMNKEIFTVVAWDPRGYGKSIPPVRDFPPDFFERDAKDAVDLMQALTFQKFSLLGWSDGGITALIAAAKYPDLIRKMVVWGANAIVTEEDVKIYNGMYHIHENELFPICFLMLNETLKFQKFSLLGWSDGGITTLITAAKYPDLIHKMVVWGTTANITEEDVKIYNGIRDVSKWSEKTRKPLEEMYGHKYFSKMCSAWVDGISQFMKNPDGDICQRLLPHIKCPTLIIHGEKDPLVPRFHAEYIHKHIQGSRLHFMPEGKHNLHLRFAEEFNKMVEEFLV